MSIATKPNVYQATVEAGVAAFRELQRGKIEHWDQFSKQSLTPKGAAIMRAVSAAATASVVRMEMIRAVQAGY